MEVWLKFVLHTVEDVIARKILYIDYEDGDILMLFHLYIHRNHLTPINDYYRSRHILHEIDDKPFGIYSVSVESFKSCAGCIPTNSKSGYRTLHWDYTKIGHRTVPKNICLQSNRMPVTRVCGGDYLYGAKWLPTEGVCADNYVLPKVTNDLIKHWDGTIETNTTTLVQFIRNLVTNTTDFIPLDIYYMSQIVGNVSDSNTSSLVINEDLSEFISNLIAVNVTTLKLSNRQLNSTNSVLDNAERSINQIAEANLDATGQYLIVKPNFMFYMSDPIISNITGIALHKRNTTEQVPFTEYDIIPIPMNTTINELIASDTLQLATYLPESLLNEMMNSTANNTNSIRVSVALYYNHSLFNGNSEQFDNSVRSPVVSMFTNNYDKHFPSPVPIMFRSNDTEEKNCVFWDYGSISNSSRWTADDGVETIENEKFCICNVTHLTQFGYLLGLPSVHWSEGASDGSNVLTDNSLDILTNVGCVLSTIGICGIFVTAGIFESWRQKIGTKVLMNISFCSVLQMISLYISDMDNFKTSSVACIISGVILHYAVLCGFAWTLVSAVLQYLRFVRIISATPAHLLLKTSIVGWILPIFLVIPALIIDWDTYLPDSEMAQLSNLCYPQGMTLIGTVLIPITCIILVNLFIFSNILYSIITKASSIERLNLNASRDMMVGKQLKLAVMLFFLLGLSWIFGLLAKTGQCSKCLYLFCVTATMQGFVIFLFFVVLDPSTRRLWVTWYKSKINQRRQQITTTDTNTHDDILASVPTKENSTGSVQNTYYKANLIGNNGNISNAEVNMQDVLMGNTHRAYGEQSVIVRRTK
ncbi:uncharacterized protein CBL_04640 [Carabus blaptoides fortunei]